MTQNELELYFSQCGRIITSRILYDNTTGQTRVTFWQCCYLMLACKRLLWQIARAVYFSYYCLFNYYDSLLTLLLIVEFKVLFYLYLCFLFPFLESFSWLTILFGLQVCLISSQLFYTISISMLPFHHIYMWFTNQKIFSDIFHL